MAEGFSYLRNAEFGERHYLNEVYLTLYAQGMACQEDYRRQTNDTLFKLIAFCAAVLRRSATFTGF